MQKLRFFISDHIGLIIMAAVVIIVCFLIFGCGGKKDSGSIPPPGDDRIFNGKLPENEKAVTPKGIKVSSRTEINTALFPEMDAGLDRLFAIASAPPNNYKFTIGHGDFKIWLLPRSPFCEAPGFLVNDTELAYNGSEYDKNPDPNISTICAAGMTIFQGSQGTAPGMAVADDFGHMRNVVRFEGEHNLLKFVDTERFFATQYHPPPHPILTSDEPASLYTKPLPFNSVTLGGNSALITK